MSACAKKRVLMTVDPDLADMMSAVFVAHREAHEPGAGVDELWAQLTELGLVRLTGSRTRAAVGPGGSKRPNYCVPQRFTE